MGKKLKSLRSKIEALRADVDELWKAVHGKAKPGKVGKAKPAKKSSKSGHSKKGKAAPSSKASVKSSQPGQEAGSLGPNRNAPLIGRGGSQEPARPTPHGPTTPPTPTRLQRLPARCGPTKFKLREWRHWFEIAARAGSSSPGGCHRRFMGSRSLRPGYSACRGSIS